MIPAGRIRYDTPTGLAEQRRDHDRAVRGASVAARWPIGPAGLAIPFPRSVYRKTKDGLLLANLAAAAAKAFRLQQLPLAVTEDAFERIAADILERFPAAEMAVLRKHGFARQIDRVWVEFDPHAEPERLPAFRPVVVPDRWPGYVVRLPGAIMRADDKRASPPLAAEPYFHKVIEVREIVRADFGRVGGEPGQFANREKRQPMWSEIEAAWPRFGAWMAYQRNPW